MQFKTITALTLGLFAASAVAQDCAVNGAQCNNPGAVACECNSGSVYTCGTSDGTPGFVWVFTRDCPPATFACVDGACTSRKLLRSLAA